MTIPYRQIHLDFHTSEHIPGIGAAWDKKHWQATLQRGHVNSINVFAVCHHGWSYYNTKIGKRHPHLAPKLDLTRAMLDACHEVGIHTQVYLTVGVNNQVAREHSEWRAINVHGGYFGWSQPFSGYRLAAKFPIGIRKPHFLDLVSFSPRTVLEVSGPHRKLGGLLPLDGPRFVRVDVP